MSAVYQGHQSSSRLFVGAVAVVAFHLMAIIAFKAGLVQQITLPQFKPPTTVIPVPVDPLPPPPPPPQVQPQNLVQEPIVIPFIEPLISIEQPVTESPITVNEAAPAAREPANASASGEGPQVTDFQLDSRYPLTKPYYPPQEVRMGHEGLVTLQIYVMPNGRVGEAKIAVSSGYPRLDESARREALKSWRFKPRMEAGAAVGSWGTFKVRFTLEQ